MTWGPGDLYGEADLFNAYTTGVLTALGLPFVTALHGRREHLDEVHSHMLSPAGAGAIRAMLKARNISFIEVRDDGKQDTTPAGLDAAARYFTQWADPRLRPAKKGEMGRFSGQERADQYRAATSLLNAAKLKIRVEKGNPRARRQRTWKRGGTVTAPAPTGPSIGLMVKVLATWQAALTLAFMAQALMSATAASRQPAAYRPRLSTRRAFRRRTTAFLMPRANPPPRTRGAAPLLPRLAAPHTLSDVVGQLTPTQPAGQHERTHAMPPPRPT
ncbi:hypothetical protein [Deinococcus navajonensis]|uniref:Uncharacterized protein n=1 Tax=Deinococcus navajonensis TaxID=309884 RepID=A0ABV8XTG7_9DEIO